MAGEIQADYPTGATLYAQVRTATGTVWNTVGVAFEAYLTANVADYDIAMAEQGTASGYYAGNFPAVAGAVYNVVVKSRVGGSPAETDPTIAAGFIEWSGSAVVSQTGDSFARIGATGSGLTSLAPSATALSTAQWTNARAGYLDNLNVGGAVASNADILALNQSASRRVLLTTVGQYERPESSSTVYTVEARTFDGDGAATNADTTPTLTATGQTTGDLSANLSAATNPATGLYRWTYTVSSAATVEPVRMDISATMTTAFTLSVYTQVVNFVAATWTSTDASNLTAIYNKLPTNNIADQTLLAASIDALPTNAELATALDPIPTAAENATAVRSELTTELGRIDAAVTTRATPAQVLTQAAAALATYDPPTNAEMEARTLLAAQYGIEATSQAVLADTNELQADWVNGGRLDLLIDAINAKTANLPAAPAATGDIPTVSQIWTTALVEAYRATGAAGTAAQLLHELVAHLGDSSISGTTKTIKNRAGTVAKTYSLDHATMPTAIEELS